MNEIYHHGVKGQKWGVRRFQNKDGSLTPAGRERYNVDIEGAKDNLKKAKANEKEAVRQYNKKTAYGTSYNQEATKLLIDAADKIKYAKQDLKSEKIKQKLNNEKKEKSQHRLKLEQQYLDKGMTKEEAEIAAYKRAKTEKILLGIGATTIAATAAYVAYKQYDKRVDKIIKSDTLLQNISRNSNRGVADAFYASKTNMDNTKYRGLYGDVLRQNCNAVYETKIKVNKNLKVASEKSAVEVLSQLVKNDANYAKTLETHLNDSSIRYVLPSQSNAIKKGLKSLQSGKVDANVYNALNLSLVNHALPTSSSVNKGFYDALKSKGYDAIVDINDKKFSGYKSSNPLIVFNGAAKTTVDSVRKLKSTEIGKAKAKGYADIMIKDLAPQLGFYGSLIGATKAVSSVTEAKSNDKIVRDYRKEHPNTELSYNEIVRNYKGK